MTALGTNTTLTCEDFVEIVIHGRHAEHHNKLKHMPEYIQDDIKKLERKYWEAVPETGLIDNEADHVIEEITKYFKTKEKDILKGI